jgi:hypothetical protein
MSDAQCNDIYMLSKGRLNELERMLKNNKSPNQSRVQDDSMSLDQSMNVF